MNKNEFVNEEVKVKGEELIKKIKQIIHQGNIRCIIIKDEKGRTYLEIPLTIGVVGAVLVPVWAALGALAAMATNFTIEIVKKEESAKTPDEIKSIENPDSDKSEESK